MPLSPSLVICSALFTQTLTQFIDVQSLEHKTYDMETRWLQSGLLIFAFSVLGLGTALLGPSLPDIAYRTNSKVSQYTAVFFGRAIGVVIGSLASSAIVDTTDHMVVMGLAIIVCGAGVWFVPYCSSIYTVAALISCLGLAVGIVDTAGNVAALALWRHKPKTQGSVLQALHAGFALGGTVCAPLARPFLGDYKVGDAAVADLMKSRDESLSEEWVQVEPDHIDGLYRIVALVIVSAGGLMLAEFKASKRPLRTNNKPSEENGQLTATEATPTMTRKQKELIGWLMLFFVLCVGSEITFAQFIYTFTMGYTSQLMGTDTFSTYWLTPPKTMRDLSTFVNFLFWFGFCLFRFGGAIATRYVSARQILWANVIGLTLTSLTMVLSSSPLVLTLMSFSFGAFIATCFASAISLAETKVAVTGAITSKFVFGAAIGWMTLPFLTGYLFDINQLR